MSVQPGPTFKRYAANGVATVYAIPFLLLNAADLQVTLNGVLVTTGFTLAGIGNPQSSCTFSTPPSGDLLFQMVVPFQRLTDYQINGDLLAETINPDFDRLWLAVKQLNRDSGRALTVSLLEPEGIPPLPIKVARALKMLAFDVDGSPITSNLTLAQLEQQPALALEAAEAAVAAANAAGLSETNSAASALSANASKNAAAGSASAAATSAQAAADAGLQLGMSTWGYRTQPFKGFGLDDGQELDRAVYPDFVAALDAGLLPTVTQAQWDANPANRAYFVANSSAGKFRMRDRNGMSPGSLGAVFERGGNGPMLIKQDQFQGHRMRTVDASATPNAWGGAPPSNTQFGADATPTNGLGVHNGTGSYYATHTGAFVADGVNGSPRVGSETYPTHVVGAWMTRLFGIITPLGSAEAASLATAYASIASRVAVLEARPTYRKWTSEPLLLNAGVREFGHSLGVLPALASVTLTLKVAVQGWQAGAVFYLASSMFAPGTPSYGHQISNMSELGFTITVGTGGFIIMNGSSYIAQSLVPSQVDVRVELKAWV